MSDKKLKYPQLPSIYQQHLDHENIINNQSLINDMPLVMRVLLDSLTSDIKSSMLELYLDIYDGGKIKNYSLIRKISKNIIKQIGYSTKYPNKFHYGYFESIRPIGVFNIDLEMPILFKPNVKAIYDAASWLRIAEIVPKIRYTQQAEFLSRFKRTKLFNTFRHRLRVELNNEYPFDLRFYFKLDEGKTLSFRYGHDNSILDFNSSWMYLNDECLGGGYVSDFFCSLKSHMKELGLYVSSKKKDKANKKA